MASPSATRSMSGLLRWLQLRDDPRPQPMITYDKGLPSLPDDIISEIFSHLDIRALKSCSLTGKALSYPAKPFIHRTLYLSPWPGDWSDFKKLRVLGERGLLRHTRRLSIRFPYDTSYAHGLDLHIQNLHTLKNLTNLRSFKTLYLNIPSSIPKAEEYLGTYLGSLQSLELAYPRGDNEDILYFACQFPNLRDLKIAFAQDHTNPARNNGSHFNIRTSPPLDGTLDLRLGMSVGVESDPAGIRPILRNLVTLPSGLKFRTLKLSWCTGDDLQPIIDACAPTLECMEFTGQWSDTPPCPRFSFKQHPRFRQLEIKPELGANTETVVRWLSETLLTITSNAFTELTIHFPQVHTASENQVCLWNSVDNVLNQRSLCGDVTLVVRPLHWVRENTFKYLVRVCFPLMWKNKKAVFRVPPPDTEELFREGIWPQELKS